MKRFLPKVVLFVCLFVSVFVSARPVHAASLIPLVTIPGATQAPSPTTGVQQPAASVPTDGWVQDPDVTFAGKAGARSGQFLDWALQNYDWAITTGNNTNPIQEVWVTIRNIVYAFFALFVLITAFLLIVTRGKSITIRKFVPRFVVIVLLVFFSFAIVQVLYQTVDVVQGFFLTNPDQATQAQHHFISQQNLLYIGFNYQDFTGYRLAGSQYDESAFISLLLVKLTALTYYVMVGILLVRKIILWFFIIISPILPLLLFYAPIRNTGKIWIGEFFRWLLYAPIFAIFLSGLVNIWRSSNGIPLPFKFSGDVVYPTAINILLGGPQQSISLSNSVNNTDTFAEYVVALFMLWVVIILPFLLLQIFLDYIKNVSLSDNVWLKQLVQSGSSAIGMLPKGPGPTSPQSSAPAGLAKQIPFASKIEIPDTAAMRQSNVSSANIQNVETSRMNSEILKLSNLQVPTIRDIARYESSMMSKDISRHEEVARAHESLEKIARPENSGAFSEKQHYSTVRKTLVTEGEKGNPLASSILSAASVVGKTSGPTTEDMSRLRVVMQNAANPASIATAVEKQKYQAVSTQLNQASASGDPLAKDILKAGRTGQVTEDLAKRLLDAKENGSTLAAAILSSANVSTLSKPDSGKLREALQTMSNPANVTSIIEKQKYEKVNAQVMQAMQKGDVLARDIVKAGKEGTFNDDLLRRIMEAKEKGNAMASSILEAANVTILSPLLNIPVINRVQQVSLDDYEAVKKVWQENYQKLEPPKDAEGHNAQRPEWLKNEMNKITETITLLLSADQQKNSKGMENVGAILPFLLIGGFSKSEIVAYLKAKFEAAKAVLEGLTAKSEEETTLLDREEKKEEKPKEMTAEAEAEIPVEEKPKEEKK